MRKQPTKFYFSVATKWILKYGYDTQGESVDTQFGSLWKSRFEDKNTI